ncbi:DUF6723 family protein [Caballeronia sp. LZ016]|uniref:DUF6723 family protein n=1 Tax=Caballeronia sp. LZ016 TaxID=3038554 RepID=UPI0028556FFE|nr:DUF6723 family protein [Caballeronia sp. LZ016]MDR5740170.1 hypothetical protein [Caballeronia sp. LZ016]
MAHIRGKRPKLALFPTKSVVPTPGATEDDFVIYASYRGNSASGYYGTLKVVRTTDGKLLYPFEGAEQIGPFGSMADAISAAHFRGDMIVNGDLKSPEL